MLSDVLLLSTVVLSGFEIFPSTDRLVVSSREERHLHFPQALASLLQSSLSWQAIGQLVSLQSFLLLSFYVVNSFCFFAGHQLVTFHGSFRNCK